MKRLVVAYCLAMGSCLAVASETLTDEPEGDAYNFVSHYSIAIHAPAKSVWKHLIDLGSWMYEFEMQPVAGFNKLEGRVLRLYEGQEFYVQITKAIPGKLLVVANLPASMQGEHLTAGVSVMTLSESAGITTVDLTMSRRYRWSKPGENHLKLRRQSTAFIETTQTTWNGFLGKLLELSVR